MSTARSELPHARAAAVAGCIEACERCAAVADALSPHQYRHAPGARSPIGAHLRHALEHVSCLLDGLAAGIVDYDARARDAALEEDPGAAHATARRLAQRLRAMDEASLESTLTVRESASSEHPPVASRSTLQRELTFASGHIIHHLEIAGLVAELQGVALPSDWGVAFSTAAYRAGT